MGKTFQKVYACSIGNFKGKGDKIPQWIRTNGGTYSKDINEEVTHLITTKEAFQQNVETVSRAKQLGTIKIVSYDWLEDSLLSKNKKPLQEGPYLFNKALKNELSSTPKDQKSRKQKVQARKRGRPGKAKCSSNPQFLMSDYHIYAHFGTIFSATLIRLSGSKKNREKLTLEISESNTEPHTYATHAKTTRIGCSKAQFLAPAGSGLDAAMSAFKELFAAETGKEWEDRLSPTLVPPRKDHAGNILPLHMGWFHYEDLSGSLSAFLRGGVAETTSKDPRLGQNNKGLALRGGDTLMTPEK